MFLGRHALPRCAGSQGHRPAAVAHRSTPSTFLAARRRLKATLSTPPHVEKPLLPRQQTQATASSHAGAQQTQHVEYQASGAVRAFAAFVEPCLTSNTGLLYAYMFHRLPAAPSASASGAVLAPGSSLCFGCRSSLMSASTCLCCPSPCLECCMKCWRRPCVVWKLAMMGKLAGSLGLES